MTFEDDFVQLNLPNGRGPLRQTCKALGVDWPPPEFIALAGGPFSTPVYRRVRYSEITDEQRQGMTHVCRGAEYVHDHERPAEPAPRRRKRQRRPNST